MQHSWVREVGASKHSLHFGSSLNSCKIDGLGVAWLESPLLVFPPHAIHALQPLDVACFGSLAQQYFDELLHRGHTT